MTIGVLILNKIIKLFSCRQVDYSGHNDAYRCGDDGLCDYCRNRIFIIGLTVLIITLLGIIIYLAIK